MRRLRLLFLLALAGVAGAGAFALDRRAALQEARARHEGARRDLEKAFRLSSDRPHVFRASAVTGKESSLKASVQEAAAARAVTIGFLSESERDLEKGRREKQVLVRLVEAPHGSVVRFLRDLEASAIGAKVKELRLQPSRTTPDAYEEVEAILARRLAREGDAR